VYWFVFRRVSEAKINSDVTALAEVLQILEYERQTWQLVCEKFGGATGAAMHAAPHSPASKAGVSCRRRVTIEARSRKQRVWARVHPCLRCGLRTSFFLRIIAHGSAVCYHAIIFYRMRNPAFDRH